MKSIYAKQPEQKAFELVEPGNYMARCYSMIQLGTHVSEYAGKQTKRERVRITWELPTELKKEGEYAGKPFAIGEEFTLSMSDMGNLRPMLESWRGKAFTEEEAQSFDITKVLEIPCLLNVIHKTNKDGKKTFAVIQSVSPLPKGMTCPPQVNETFIFTTEDFDGSELSKLPEFIQKRIMDSLEYKGENYIAPVEDDEIPNDPWGGKGYKDIVNNKPVDSSEDAIARALDIK